MLKIWGAVQDVVNSLTSAETVEQAKNILQEQKDLIVKNLAESYQVSLSAESVTASQAEVAKSKEAEEGKYKSDSEESRSSEEIQPSHQESADQKLANVPASTSNVRGFNSVSGSEGPNKTPGSSRE